MAAELHAIDELDRRIVERLRVDGRETNRSLAATLGVNEATIAARLRRLEAARLIHVVALTDIQRLGFACFALAMITVAERPVLAVAADLAQIPQTISVNVHTGRYDVICAVLARDLDELGEVIGEAIPRVAGVATVRCELAVDVPRFDSAWAALTAGQEGAELPRPSLPTGAVDDLDLRIIEALQQDARSSNRSIAAALDVSEGTVRTRLRRMEDEGLVRIRAVSDVLSFGLRAAATIGVHVDAGQIDAAARGLGGITGVAAIIRSLGEFDFVLIVIAHTREELLDQLLNGIQALPGIRATETFENVATLKHVYTWVRLVEDAASEQRAIG
ncbi:MAG TPA: Lrp/AsnC family transcriptional regulator [Solirubrobacteraceae bacterium]|jgi:DNA-binding Lrp family transcriptional regulator|nr:Lrp/AsnC family transcriptional regulator [Solirubrobacteraceae bacterium]